MEDEPMPLPEETEVNEHRKELKVIVGMITVSVVFFMLSAATAFFIQFALTESPCVAC